MFRTMRCVLYVICKHHIVCKHNIIVYYHVFFTIFTSCSTISRCFITLITRTHNRFCFLINLISFHLQSVYLDALRAHRTNISLYTRTYIFYTHIYIYISLTSPIDLAADAFQTLYRRWAQRKLLESFLSFSSFTNCSQTGHISP